MSASAAIAVGTWLALSLASVGVWRWPASRTGRPALARTGVLVAIVSAQVAVTGLVAMLADAAAPVSGPWVWLVVGAGGAAAVLAGGAVVFCILGLADASSRPGNVRVQRTVLRGGAWIGALERLGLVASLLAGWPDGLVVIVAVKAFARYPELKTGQASGAIERFIIGTFTSLGWAAICAGITMLLL